MNSMDQDNSAQPATAGHLRRKLMLNVVGPDARGFVIPPSGGRVTYRGRGWTDYACGGCGHLLAIGVPTGLFQSFLFACVCGSLNRVP